MSMNIIPCPPRRLPEFDRSVSHPVPAGGWPSITIITPSLNRVSLIESAIASVIGQGYPSVEHIVIDGGSTDSTPDILASYPHLRVIRESDRGSHHAMNKGLALATGQIVGFLNTDDFYAPGIFHAVGRYFADEQIKLISGQCFFFSTGPNSEPLIDAELRHVAEPGPYLSELFYATPGFNAYFFRRDLLTTMDDVNERFDVAADRDLLIRIALAGHRPLFIGNEGYYYRRHPGSRTLDSEGKLSAAILDDHCAIAARLATNAATGAGIRKELRQWGALEAARLLKQSLLDMALGNAALGFMRAFCNDPLWLLRIGSARDACRQLQSLYK